MFSFILILSGGGVPGSLQCKAHSVQPQHPGFKNQQQTFVATHPSPPSVYFLLLISTVDLQIKTVMPATDTNVPHTYKLHMHNCKSQFISILKETKGLSTFVSTIWTASNKQDNISRPIIQKTSIYCTEGLLF